MTTLTNSKKTTEQNGVKKKASPPAKKAIHVSIDTYNRFRNIVDSVNDKKFGKKASSDDVILEVLDNCSIEAIIPKIQEKTLTQKDLIQQSYEKFCKENGHIAYDEFIFQAINRPLTTVNSK